MGTRIHKKRDLEGALDRYFSSFDSTRILASELILDRRHPVEVLVLLCSRLDALASDAVAEGTPSKQAFIRFLTAYSGNKDLFESVSMGDLYYELAYHRWLLEGTVPKPGRLHRFSRVDDPIIHLLEDCGLPLTLKDCKILFDTLIRILKHEYHVKPGQPLSKPRTAKIKQLKQAIEKVAMKSRLRAVAASLPKALESLLESKKIGTILYERFRCESIHGATLTLDEKAFFSETGVYWQRLYSEYYGAFELIEFSAPFLLSTLETCIKTYRAHLLAKGRIPPDVHFHAFDEDFLSSLEFLDESLLPEGGEVRFRINR